MAMVESRVKSRSCRCFDSDADQAVQLFHRRRGGRPGSCLVLATALGLILLPTLPAAAARMQDASPPPLGAGAQQGREAAGALHGSPAADPLAQHVEEHMAQRRNSERQKTLEADTERLLLLAQQLKVEVDKSNKDTLSIDVVKRAEQIEKLAHSVKEKMRGN